MVGATAPAYVTAYQSVIRSRIAYDVSFQNEKSGPTSFLNATKAVYETLVESARRRIELSILGYGRSGLGIVSSVNTNTITLTAASWAPGIWTGSKGAELEIYDGATGTDTKRTYAGGLNTFTVSSIDLANKAITVDNATNVTGGDVIYFRTQRTATAWADMVGLEQIATTSGTLFGIDNSTYEVFAGSSKDAGSTDLSVDTLLSAAAGMAVRGADGDLKCWISPVTYANFVSELAALVRYDNSDNRYNIGAESIKVSSPTGAKIMIDAHPCLKEGEGYLFEPNALMRSGPTDLTFNRAHIEGGAKSHGDSFFSELSDNAGYEIRAYSYQFVFTHKPACFCKITGIVNS